MITIKKDGMVIQVETLEEYKMVMGENSTSITVVNNSEAPKGAVAKEIFNAISECPPKEKVYLSAKCHAAWEVVRQVADERTSINSRELADWMEMPATNASGTYMSEMCRKGLLMKVPGHWGWTVTPNWQDKYEVVIGRDRKVRK